MYGDLAHSALSIGEPLLIIFNITTAPRLVPFIHAMPYKLSVAPYRAVCIVPDFYQPTYVFRTTLVTLATIFGRTRRRRCGASLLTL